jgi:hypothetical protein
MAGAHVPAPLRSWCFVAQTALYGIGLQLVPWTASPAMREKALWRTNSRFDFAQTAGLVQRIGV